jgi:glycosyltransferase involved in cell wall biosynthesis
MNAKCRVSVVTAVRNGAPYFERVVSSVLQQDLREFEWVIVDDGSTDRTADLLKSLSTTHRNVRLFQPGRIGFSRALNLGIANAASTIIARQDFDDTSTPDRLRLQVEYLEQHSDVGLVGGYYIVVDEIRCERYVRKPPLDHDSIVRTMAKRVPFAHTTVMFRREAWSAAGGYVTADAITDLPLWVAMGERGWRFANIPYCLGEHYVYKESQFRRAHKYRYQQGLMLRAQVSAIRKLDLPLWMYAYPLGRVVYMHLPNRWKQVTRRSLGGSQEEDLTEQAAIGLGETSSGA